MNGLKKIWYNFTSTPYYELVILDRGEVVGRAVDKKWGQDTIRKGKNDFILPKPADNPFFLKEKLKTVYFYNIENALWLKEKRTKRGKKISVPESEILPAEAISADLLEEEKVNGKVVNPNVLQVLLGDDSVSKILSKDKTSWDEIKPFIYIGAFLVLVYLFFGGGL